jgi:hypothetical protein
MKRWRLNGCGAQAVRGSTGWHLTIRRSDPKHEPLREFAVGDKRYWAFRGSSWGIWYLPTLAACRQMADVMTRSRRA